VCFICMYVPLPHLVHSTIKILCEKYIFQMTIRTQIYIVEILKVNFPLDTYYFENMERNK
jgi:hypothetical protein